jgi:hypothetical protein
MRGDKAGGESRTVYKPRQLVDIIPVSFLPVGENPVKLRDLRLKDGLSLRQLSRKTRHSISYLQQQLRKFGIDKAKGNLGIAPYGWDWTGNKLVKNTKEQTVICEMVSLKKKGLTYGRISSWLNDKRISAKSGGRWWPATVKKILQRTIKGIDS